MLIEPLMRHPLLDLRKPAVQGARIAFNRQHRFLKDCVGAFYFLEGAGAPINLINGRATTIVGPDCKWVARRNGVTIDFQGDNDNDRIDLGAIDTTDPLNCNSTNECTVICKVLYQTPGNSFPRIIDKSSAGSSANGWAFYLEGTTRAVFSIAGTNYRPTFSPVNNRYYTFGASVQGGSGGSYRFFVDNRFDSATGVSQSFPATQTNAAIGNWNHSTDRNWKGSIDYVLVYNRALTDGEVVEIGRHPYAPFERQIWVPVGGAPPAANPKGPLGHPLQGALGGPI